MVASLKPSAVEVIKFQLPEHIRLDNPQLVQFLEYYYEYMNQQGQSLNFLNNLVEYNDLDFQENVFNTLTIKMMMSLLPQNTRVDKKLLMKKLSDFFKSKGTEESYKFIMNVLFDEQVKIDWQSKNVMKASANKFSRRATLSLCTTDSFHSCVGAMVIQTAPHAYGIISSITSIDWMDKRYQQLILDEHSVREQFVVGAEVRVLRNDIDRTFTEITEYCVPSTIEQSTINLTGTFSNISYVGYIIKQINTDYQATITNIATKSFNLTKHIWQFVVNSTGTADLVNDMYIISPSILNTHYTKADYYKGIVSPTLDIINVNPSGAMYRAPLPIRFDGGDGNGASAYIAGVTSGKVDEVIVVHGGEGYSVGDAIVNVDPSFRSQAVEGHVESIDGIGADIKLIMELDAFIIKSGGYGFAVGDTMFIDAETPITLTVASVDSSSAVTGLTITSRGSFAVCPAWHNISPTIKTGRGTGLILSLTFRANSAVLSNPGTQYKNVTLAFDGVGSGAVLVPTVRDGVIYAAGITVSNAGSGYTIARAYVSGHGSGVVLTPIISSGTITGFVIYNGGYGYTSGGTIVISGDGVNAAASVTTVRNGCVIAMNVLDGGANYPDTTTVSYLSSNGGSYVPCLLSANVTDGGVIKSVDVIDPGHGYTDASFTFELLNEDATSLLQENGKKVIYDNSTDTVIITGSSTPILNTTIRGNGEIVSIDVVDGGTGYFDNTEVTPTYITVNDHTGYGAILLPDIQDGAVVGVHILDSGYAYSNSTTLTVTADGVNAALVPVIIDTKISSVKITNNGTGYKYGTSVLLYGGGGFGATAKANVLTGISSVDVLFGGKYYHEYSLKCEDGFRFLTEDYDGITAMESTSIVVTDPTGYGAVLEPIVDPLTTEITEVKVINPGYGYTNPSYALTPDYSSNPDITARFKINVKRNITSVDVVSHGEEYQGCNVLISGGDGAVLKINSELNRSLCGAELTSAGSGMTMTPKIIITDSSGHGAVSSVAVTNAGAGYKTLPVVTIPNKYTGSTPTAFGVKLITMSDSIGSVEKIAYTEGGYGYYDMPSVIFPVPIMVKENALFTTGEIVTLKNKTYSIMDTSFHLMTEAGETLTSWTGDDYIDQVEINNSIYEFKGRVYEADHDRQIVYVVFDDIPTDNFNIVTEDGQNLLSNNNMNMVYENSASVKTNDVLYGETSRQSATVLHVTRASGIAAAQGINYTNYKFESNIGMLNDPAIKLHNNERIQDFAYVMTTGLSIDQYSQFIKKAVHPAGYAMYGDIEIFMENTNQDTTIRLPIDKLKQLMTIFITLDPAFSAEILTYFDYPFDWFDTNKFYLNSVASRPQRLSFVSSDISGTILSETGDRLIQETYSRYSVSGVSLLQLKDYTMADESKVDSHGWTDMATASYVNQDGSMEIEGYVI